MEDQASLESVKRSPKKILQKYRMNARYCKGFNSIGAMWQAYNGDKHDVGFKDIGKPIKILYYGDLNPSGWAIPEIIVRQFKEMGLDIELKRKALNPAHLKGLDIPAYTKISGDPRRKEFNMIFGYQEWEDEPEQIYKDPITGKKKKGKKHLNIDLEKIPPDIFEDMLDKDIQESIDMKIHRETKAMENQERDDLEGFIQDLRDMHNEDDDDDDEVYCAGCQKELDEDEQFPCENCEIITCNSCQNQGLCPRCYKIQENEEE
jgi:hypothetical protein